MESNHRNGQSRPKPPPRSSSIRANLCKFLTSKTSKTSYVLNHHHSHVHNDDCHSKHSFNETTAKTLPKSHVSCSSLSTSSSSPHDGRSSSHPLARLREEPTAKSVGFASKHINFFRSKKQSSSVDMEFNEIPGVSSKKKLWIKSFTSLNGPLLAAGGRDTASGDTQENVVSREGPSSIPSNLSSKQEPSAITSQIVNINTSGVKMRVKKAMEQQGKKSRPKSEATFFEELYSKKKMESNVQKGNNKKQNRYSTIEGNLRFGSLETYARLDPLGEGSYATVYKGYSYLMSKVVALKEIRLEMEEGTPFTAIREASILRCLRHANIVTLHDIIHTKETLTFVFEFVQTDLSRYLELHPGGLHPDNVRIFLFQLLRGLEFCHKRQILHRDLKPQNLLISEIGDLKLADFGLARAKSVPSSTYSHEVVTLWYRPPDVLLGSTDYTTSLDIWGVGCIFVEMISGAAAFPGVKDANDQLDKIWKVLGTPSTKDWDQLIFLPHFKPHSHRSYPAKKLSEAFPDLTKIALGEEFADKCLQLNPKKRISASDALQDSFFSPLPDQVHKLTPAETIFSVPGIKLKPELTTISSSALKAAKKLREKQKRSSRD